MVFLKIGALTSKPYTFSVRPWELEKINFIDFFDSFGTEIYVEIFGLEVKRILPKINKSISNLWITDRIRFFYDSLNNQRLTTCYINLYNKYKIYSWFGVFLYLKSILIFNLKKKTYLFESITFSFFYYLNTNVDLYSLIFIKHYFLTFNFFDFNYISNFDLFNLNIDFLNNFFFDLNLINNFNNIILFGYNIRCEHPLLYLKILDLLKKKKLNLYFFGVPFLNFKFNYIVLNIGLSLKNLYYFFKNFFFKVSTLFLIGSAFLNRFDFFLYDFFLKKLQFIYTKYNIYIKLIYIYFFLLDVNLLFLGLRRDFRNIIINLLENKKFLNYCSFNIFLFENDYFFKSKLFSLSMIRLYNNNFMSNLLNLFIFCGSHFLSDSQFFNLLIPIPFFFEKDNLILNIFSIFYKTKFIYAPNILVKDTLSFYYVFINKFIFLKKNINIRYFFFLVKYNIFQFNFIELNNRNFFFYKTLYIFKQINFNYFFSFNFFIKINFFNNLYLYNINNFYFVNNYAKLSKNLNLASLNFKIIYNK